VQEMLLFSTLLTPAWGPHKLLPNKYNGHSSKG